MKSRQQIDAIVCYENIGMMNNNKNSPQHGVDIEEGERNRNVTNNSIKLRPQQLGG